MLRRNRIAFLPALLLFCVLANHARALEARIDGLNDLSFPTWSLGQGDLNGSIDICIHAVGLLGGNTYTIIVSSAGLLGFVLTDPSLHTLPFQLSWESSGTGRLGSTTGTQLINTIPLLALPNGNAADNSCASGANARLYVKILATDLTAALSGTYSGSVNILVAPI